MALTLQQGIKQTQKLALTQTMLQGIELLQLSSMELYERITMELLDNPVLEEGAFPEETTVPVEGWEGPGEEVILDGPPDANEEDIEFSDSGYDSPALRDDSRKDIIQSAIAKKESLFEHLLWQARLSSETEADLVVYEGIITTLDERGFLKEGAAELAKDLHVDPMIVAGILESIRLFDPVGCGAGSVQESICIQAHHYYPDDDLLGKIAGDFFHELENLDHEKIARELHVPVQRVLEKSALVKSLNPYPGCQFSTDQTSYVTTDIEVRLIDGGIIVTLNDSWIPKLAINSYYLRMLKKKNIEKNLKEYIQGKVQSARDLMRNISTRRQTILKVMDSIMRHQKDFIRSGPGNLKPLTHIDVARDISMHESTVSRVTRGKYVQTPWGVFDCKYFFVSRLRSGGDETSSDRVMMRIRQIVDGEKKAKPLSDEEIVIILGREGVHLARRTVAKYRGILGIPSSGMRRRIYKSKSKGSV